MAPLGDLESNCPRRVPGFTAALALAGVLLFLATAGAQGQARVTVQVHDSAGSAVSGAQVSTVSAEEQRIIASALTSSDGVVEFQVPGPGEYRFVIQRMETADWESPVYLLGARDTALVLVVPAAAVPLDPIDVVTANRCPGTANPAELVSLLETMLASLRAVMAAQEELVVVGELIRPVTRIPRERRVGALRGVSAFMDTSVVEVPNPLPAPEPELLLTLGFAQPTQADSLFAEFYPVTPELLTSEAFYRTHCFSIGSRRSDAIGLRFRRMENPRHVHVTGTVWLDPVAGTLMSIEYDYLEVSHVLRYELPRWEDEVRSRYGDRMRFLGIDPLGDNRLGGQISFGTLEDGAPAIFEWEVRGGVLGSGTTVVSSVFGAESTARAHPVVTSFRLLSVKRP